MAIRTARLAEICASQGHLEEAVSIFAELVEATPGEALLRRRLSELRALLNARVAAGAAEAQVDRLRALKRRIHKRRRAR